MELDQAATRSLVRALQHLNIQDVRGRCGQVTCFDETWNIYKEDLKTWAAIVNWDVSGNIVIKRK